MAPTWTDEAFEAFHGATATSLWRYLCRTTGNTAIAEDVLQESYLRLLARPHLEDDFQRRRAYLYRIAANLLRDRWRRGGRERDGLERFAKDHGEAVAQGADQRLREAELQAHLDCLAPRERSLLWLALVEGYSHRDIAEILDVRPASVKVMVYRAKKKLAVRLRAHGYRGRINK